jgi:ABC-type phosphate transport system substrate-binding protein
MKRRTGLLATLLAACAFLFPRGKAAGDGFGVVVNHDNGVESFSRSDLKRLVSGEMKTWGSGAVVYLGIIPSDAAETQYLATIVEKTTSELLGMIQQKVFNGELRRPAVLHSSAECLAFVSSSPGGICVASTSVPVPAGARVVPIR